MKKTIVLVIVTLSTLISCQLVLAVRNNTTLELSVINKTIAEFYDDGEDDSDDEDESIYEVEEIYEEIVLDEGSSDDDSSSSDMPCIVINDPIIPAIPTMPTVELAVGDNILQPNAYPEMDLAVETAQVQEVELPEITLDPFAVIQNLFVTASALNVRTEPTTENSDNIISTIPFNQEVQVLGEVTGTDFVYTGSVEDPVFISKNYLSEEKQTDWSGANKLTKTKGTVIGPSGKETYYNLNMSKCIATMRERGNNDPYWVRHDGAKMLGNYVMVAADLNKHPRGSLVPTSLGTGIVVDTGKFAHNGSGVNLDICTAW
jgi:hypothetical protein